MINKARLKIDVNGHLIGENIIISERYLKDIQNIFRDGTAIDGSELDNLVYRVEMDSCECDGKSGGLFFGTSYIMPGMVGNEYFMTKGHFHAIKDTGEYYWGISGNGILLLMDENRNYWAEEVCSGSVHYIKGHVAHRLINIGNEILSVGACWPSNAGHDYDTILTEGFSARVVESNGSAVLIAE